MSVDDNSGEADGPRIAEVLVPVDGTDASMAAVDHAAIIAARYDADVHALFVHGPEGMAALGTQDDHQAVADQTQAVLDSVRQVCDEWDVAATCSTAVGFSTARLTQHPGSVILDCADDVDADFLVISRERESDAPGMLEKAAEYVLAYASQPVLSV